MQSKDFTVWLKIRHANVDPDSLSQALGIVPEFSRKGGESETEDDDARSARRGSYWIGQVPAIPFEHAWLEGTLMFAACLLERAGDLWVELRADGATAELLVMLGGSHLSGFELPRELLAMLSKVGLSISVDVCDAAEAAA